MTDRKETKIELNENIKGALIRVVPKRMVDDKHYYIILFNRAEKCGFDKCFYNIYYNTFYASPYDFLEYQKVRL